MFVVKVEGPGAEPMTKLVARACFLSGLYVQSFCLPHAGYVKCDKQAVLSKQEEFADFLVILSSARLQEVLKHAKEKSTVIINAREKPRLPAIKRRRLKLHYLDATGIALNAIRRPEPDAVMLGALVKHCDKISAKAARLSLGTSKELHIALEDGMRHVK